MGGISRQINRNKLKKELGNNKINEAYHNEYDSIEQKMRREIKNEKNNRV